jgi:hypothetical protein
LSKWGKLAGGTKSNNLQFTDDRTKKVQNVVPHTNKGSMPFSVLMFLYSCHNLLVEENKQYYQQYLNSFDDRPSPAPDVTESETLLVDC